MSFLVFDVINYVLARDESERLKKKIDNVEQKLDSFLSRRVKGIG